MKNKKNIIKLKSFFEENEELLKELIEEKANNLYNKLFEIHTGNLELHLNKNDLKYYLIEFYDLDGHYYSSYGGFTTLQKLYLYIVNHKLELDLIKDKIVNLREYLKRECITTDETLTAKNDLKEFRKLLKDKKETFKYLNKYEL